MASYNTVITNEGAALLASVIANQGTLTFSEIRFSTNDYDGVEATLTVGTFAGVFITAAAAGSVVDATTIKVAAQFDNSGIVGDHPLYSIGIVGTDGNTTALIAVCTTTNPDVIREPLTGTSTYAFNVNLSVSDTSQITVVGTTAAVIYDIDVIDNLTSTATNKPLSANQGRLIADNLAANENVYGAKNLLSYPYEETTKTENGVTFTDNGDGTISVVASSGATADTYFGLHYPYKPLYVEKGTYIASGCPAGGSESTYYLSTSYGNDTGDGITATELLGDNRLFLIVIKSGTAISTPITFYPMLRDARVLDDTFVPFAKTNLQLTDDKAERNDLSTIHATGSTNTTGTQINAGTFFYLNGQFCKAIADIAVNAAFTLNTNYENTTVSKELKDALDYSGTYIFNGTPAYEGYGGVIVPAQLPIPASLLSEYSITVTEMSIGRSNGANISLTIDSRDKFEKNHGGVQAIYTLQNYFGTTSPVYANFAALRDAYASILVKLTVAHT